MMIEIELEKTLKSFKINAKFNFKGYKNVLFGESGSGKSSILKMIAGFFEPDRGVIKVKGKILFDSFKGVSVPVFKRSVGYIPQDYTLFPHMSVEDNILYGVKAKKMKLDEELYSYLIDKTGLWNFLKAYPDELSGGQKQRVSLVRALMNKPDVLLLDEPFSALDKPIREDLGEVVIDIVDNLKIPTILVSHDLDEAFGFADEIAVIKNGKIVQFGERDRVFSNPKNSSVAKILGYKNIFPVSDVFNDCVKVGNFCFKARKVSPDDRFCFIKAEDVLILRDDKDFSDKENVVFAKVIAMYERPNSVFIKMEAGDLYITTFARKHVVNKMNIKTGSKLVLSLKREGLIGGS